MVMKKSYYSIDGEIIGEKSAGVRTDYLTDALGSVTATVDQTGSVINRYIYKPYGGLLAKTGVGADPSYQWVGSHGYRQTTKKYSDVYVRARHYETTCGRWTTKDPLGFSGDLYNIFRYANCSPAFSYDFTGLKCDSCFAVLASACPKRCQGTNKAQDPEIQRPVPCPILTQKITSDLLTICKINMDLFNGSDIPGDWIVATTDCCIDTSCTFTKVSKEKGTEVCSLIRGCTICGAFAKVPLLFQPCLIDHEGRRRFCCENSCSAGLKNKVDAFIQIKCLWDNIVNCYGGSKTIMAQLKSCTPPSGYKLPNPVDLCANPVVGSWDE